MNTRTTLLAMIACAAVSTGVHAQEKPQETPPQAVEKDRIQAEPRTTVQRPQRPEDQLDLTPEQREYMREVNQRYGLEMRKLMEENHDEPDMIPQKRQELMQQRDAELRRGIGEEQFNILEQARKDQDRRRTERREQLREQSGERRANPDR